MDTSGPPDQTVAYAAGQGEYQTVRAQSAPEYVAVAAFTGDATGPVAEIELPWDVEAPVSPPDQYARKITPGG